MNLQISLFSNKSVSKKVEFRYSSVINRSFNLSEEINLEEFMNEFEFEFMDDKELVKMIKESLNNGRVVRDFWGSKLDSYFNLYACNLNKKFDSKIVVYSVQDLLQMFISGLSKCDVNVLTSIPNIDKYSRDILEMEFLTDVSLVQFLGLSDELDNFIQHLFLQENNPQELLKLFIENVNTYMTRVLKYIAIYLETYSNLVFLALDKSKIIFRSGTGEADVLNIESSMFKYTLYPLVTEGYTEYFKKAKDFRFGVLECT